MMNKILKIIFFLVCAIMVGYLAFPNPDFPSPLPDSLQSKEPADSETPLRRAYFTNYTRDQVMNFYLDEFRKPTFFGIPIFSFRLNYPPEDAKTIIRDQTRSTFLEEIVHPFRESIYINGFEPKDDKDEINIEGRRFRQKIIVRYVPSNVYIRLVIFVLTAIVFYTLCRFWGKSLSVIGKRKIKL